MVIFEHEEDCETVKHVNVSAILRESIFGKQDAGTTCDLHASSVHQVL